MKIRFIVQSAEVIKKTGSIIQGHVQAEKYISVQHVRLKSKLNTDQMKMIINQPKPPHHQLRLKNKNDMTKQEFMAMSLPSGLKMKAPHGFSPNGKESTGVSGVIYLTHNLYADIEEKVFGDVKFIPIVRPLSDLNKQITHNGKTFVPIAKLFKMPDSEVDIIFASEECVQFINKRTRCHYSFYVAIMRLTEALKLIEWHFNIMDDSEPFIPVTETFNPYK